MINAKDFEVCLNYVTRYNERMSQIKKENPTTIDYDTFKTFMICYEKDKKIQQLELEILKQGNSTTLIKTCSCCKKDSAFIYYRDDLQYCPLCGAKYEIWI